MWTRAFWAALAERTVRTIAQALAAVLIAAGTGLLDTDWLTAGSVALMAGVLSALTSIATGSVTGDPAISEAPRE